MFLSWLGVWWKKEQHGLAEIGNGSGCFLCFYLCSCKCKVKTKRIHITRAISQHSKDIVTNTGSCPVLILSCPQPWSSRYLSLAYRSSAPGPIPDGVGYAVTHEPRVGHGGSVSLCFTPLETSKGGKWHSGNKTPLAGGEQFNLSSRDCALLRWGLWRGCLIGQCHCASTWSGQTSDARMTAPAGRHEVAGGVEMRYWGNKRMGVLCTLEIHLAAIMCVGGFFFSLYSAVWHVSWLSCLALVAEH